MNIFQKAFTFIVFVTQVPTILKLNKRLRTDTDSERFIDDFAENGHVSRGMRYLYGVKDNPAGRLKLLTYILNVQ